MFLYIYTTYTHTYTYLFCWNNKKEKLGFLKKARRLGCRKGRSVVIIKVKRKIEKDLTAGGINQYHRLQVVLKSYNTKNGMVLS